MAVSASRSDFRRWSAAASGAGAPLEPEDLALTHPGPRGQRDQVQPLRVPPLAGAEEGRKLGLGERGDRGARFLFRPPPRLAVRGHVRLEPPFGVGLKGEGSAA